MMYARIAFVSSGFKAGENEAIPRADRMPFNTTASNPSWL
jgi:hypothetical protein